MLQQICWFCCCRGSYTYSTSCKLQFWISRRFFVLLASPRSKSKSSTKEFSPRSSNLEGIVCCRTDSRLKAVVPSFCLSLCVKIWQIVFSVQNLAKFQESRITPWMFRELFARIWMWARLKYRCLFMYIRSAFLLAGICFLLKLLLVTVRSTFISFICSASLRYKPAV